MNKEFILWGIKNNIEDIIRVDGEESQKSLKSAEEIKKILIKRREFESIRIQIIDFNDYDLKKEFKEVLK